MNAEQFKKIIKQCIKEAIREELPLVLMEYQQRPTSAPVITESMKPLFMNDPEETNVVRNELKNKMSYLFGMEPQPKQQTAVVAEEGGNPYLSLLAETANNMSAQDIAGLRNMG